MSLQERFLPITKDCKFTEDGYFVWCGSVFRWRGRYYLAYSRWKRELGFQAWVTDSEICLARSDSLFGKFSYIRTIRTKDGLRRWDSSCAHNPTVMVQSGKCYLYYMGNDGEGGWWDCRNRQRIGVAEADDPEGEWRFFDRPVIDVSDDGIDSLMTSNPSVTAMPDGRFYMIYKAVSKDGELPRGGAVICGGAFADDPLGPFVKTGVPIMVNPTNGWSVEDPFVWFEDGKLRAVVKDFHGYFTHTDGSACALFESSDGLDWRPSADPLAFGRMLPTENGPLPVFSLERPQLYFEDGRAKALVCACSVDREHTDVFSVRIPLA